MTRDGYRSAQAAYDAAEPEDAERVDLGLSDGQALAECVVDLCAALAEARERLREASAPTVMVVRQGNGSERRRCVGCDGSGLVWAQLIRGDGGKTALRCPVCSGEGER
ncbi:MAG: hypothetical protein IPK80_02865 [Nannocystis sp.]|nr:hypothetical protein [Nannocystis sp.]